MNSQPHHMQQREYTETELQQLLAEDPGIAEQGITVIVRGDTLVLCGEVESGERRDHIVQLVAERFPDARVESDIGVTRTQPPEEVEKLQ
ncbi:MAG: BON domain-containing protein [Micromonosporaceae bacterium]